MKRILVRAALALTLVVGGIAPGMLANQHAYADFIPPPPPPPPPPPASPATPDTSDHGGNRGKVDIGRALANGAVCTIGGMMINRASDVPSSLLQQFENTIVCNGVAMLVAGPPGFGGLFGLVASQTICCGSQSMVVKTLRPRGWQCQPGDRTEGCAQWLQDRVVPKRRTHRRRP